MINKEAFNEKGVPKDISYGTDDPFFSVVEKFDDVYGYYGPDLTLNQHCPIIVVEFNNKFFKNRYDDLNKPIKQSILEEWVKNFLIKVKENDNY